MSKFRITEKEKTIAEQLNSRVAMLGFIVTFGVCLRTGQIIPGMA